MDHIKLTFDKLDVNEITELVASPSCGAVSVFIGMTRDNFENKKVVQLEYEAYSNMAEKAVKKICEDIRAKWEIENIAVYHRLGVVPVKEASVVIAVSSPHRASSLESVQFAIDELKSTVPIWKKEVYDTDSSQWKSNTESCAEQESFHEDGSSSEADAEDELSPELVQIRAGSEEISRRIAAFIESKRQHVNLSNIHEFCYPSNGNETTDETSSCARVDALLVCRKDSKSHLRVRRVNNAWGPQTRPATETKTKTECDENKPEVKSSCPFGLTERLKNVEDHLALTYSSSVPMNVYERLRMIEDRILKLEALSPEYFSVPLKAIAAKSPEKRPKPGNKRVFSITDLNTKLSELEYRLTHKKRHAGSLS